MRTQLKDEQAVDCADARSDELKARGRALEITILNLEASIDYEWPAAKAFAAQEIAGATTRVSRELEAVAGELEEARVVIDGLRQGFFIRRMGRRKRAIRRL